MHLLMLGFMKILHVIKLNVSKYFLPLVVLIVQISLFQDVTFCDALDTTSLDQADADKEREVVPNKAMAIALFVFTSVGAGIFGGVGLIVTFAYIQGVGTLLSTPPDLSAFPDSQVPPVAESMISAATTPEVVTVANTVGEGEIWLSIVIVFGIPLAILAFCCSEFFPRTEAYMSLVGSVAGGIIGHTVLHMVEPVLDHMLELEQQPTLPQESDSQAPPVAKTVNPPATDPNVTAIKEEIGRRIFATSLGFVILSGICVFVIVLMDSFG
jgi:hypothetical protein